MSNETISRAEEILAAVEANSREHLIEQFESALDVTVDAQLELLRESVEAQVREEFETQLDELVDKAVEAYIINDHEERQLEKALDPDNYHN